MQRLHEITEDGALAEGLRKLSKDGGVTWKFGMSDRDGWPGTDDYGWPWAEWSQDHMDAFAKAWDRINGKRATWASNPWVWALTFRRVKP